MAVDDVRDDVRAVGAVLTIDELRALGALLRFCASIGAAATEEEALVRSALVKLLDKPSDLACCYQERARIVKLLNEQLLDETPTNANGHPLAVARDAGYRAGHNDRARSLAKELQS